MTVTSGQAPSVSLAAYQGITVSASFVAPTSGSGTLTVSDATTPGTDITPAGLPADNANAGFTPLVYLSFYNGGSDISFAQNFPKLTVTASFGTKTICEFDVYAKNGGGTATWNNINQTGTIAGGSVTIGPGTLPAGNTVDFQPGQQILAVACK